jgi:predicted nuclease of predicted toxin-antitoxin system
MRFVADESVDNAIVARLRANGQDVDYVAEVAPSLSDDEVIDRANSQSALLVTEDKDFGELVYRLRRVHGGVVLVRLPGMSTSLKADIVAETVTDRGVELPKAFTVISPGLVRIRR